MGADTCCRRFYKTLVRTKEYRAEQVEETSLRRCLSQWDVIAIGVGSTLGVGLSFIVGHVGLIMAGPSMVLSFLIGAVAALFAGLCFAEFGARAPRAGGAYSYTYLALGELMAFIVGWNNLLRFSCSSAGLARGVSLFLEGAFNISISKWLTLVAPVSLTFMAEYFDLFAFLIVIIMGAVLMLGVRESALVNNVFSAASLVTVLFIMIVGAFAADISNWQLPAEVVPAGAGDGGFFPFGVMRMIEAAGVCFYGYVGFDTICAAGEEMREPRRMIPIMILATIGISLVCYIGLSTVVTMMMPYYMIDNVIATLEAFEYVNWEWARWIVGIGSVVSFYACIFGSLYPLTRLVYSMSEDGLFVGLLSKVVESRHSPVFATILCTIVTAFFAGFLAMRPLLQLVGLAALITYTAVAASVIVLRYKSNYTPGKPRYLRQVFGLGRSPTLASCRVVNVCLVFFSLGLLNAVIALHAQGADSIAWFVVGAVVNGVELLLLLVIMVQPQIKEDIYFKTPLVPLVPCISIYMNIHIMVLNILDLYYWRVLGIWLAIGIVIYLLSICCCKKPQKEDLQENIELSQTNINGKPPVQIIVESPTPPDTLTRVSTYGGDQFEDIIEEETPQHTVRNELPVITEEITVHQASIENNEEKEAKIIDLLDQVLQAEEDTYGEVISVKDQKEDCVITENAVQRKSLSELSDAGSDASLGNQGLSKYDVIAQVHREDLPRVSEEEEKIKEDITDDDEVDHEQVTAFNDSDTNSRTDESGYSDTIDRNALSESFEESKEEVPIIPVPPPLDENYFRSSNFKKSFTITPRHVIADSEPKDENEENKPRESIKSTKSNGSQNEDSMIFGSDRQIHFMSKLNTIFQNKITTDDAEPLRRSHSTGNVVENTDFSVSRERTPLFLALKSEIVSKEAAQNLRPVNTGVNENVFKEETTAPEQPVEEEEEESSLTKDELKFKLENIFATGGAQLVKPRLMKSNPPTPEDSYQTDVSSTESLPKLPKMDKNDTLKRQKDKFNEVLNSFRISMNADDV